MPAHLWGLWLNFHQTWPEFDSAAPTKIGSVPRTFPILIDKLLIGTLWRPSRLPFAARWPWQIARFASFHIQITKLPLNRYRIFLVPGRYPSLLLLRNITVETHVTISCCIYDALNCWIRQSKGKWEKRGGARSQGPTLSCSMRIIPSFADKRLDWLDWKIQVISVLDASMGIWDWTRDRIWSETNENVP